MVVNRLVCVYSGTLLYSIRASTLLLTDSIVALAVPRVSLTTAQAMTDLATPAALPRAWREAT